MRLQDREASIPIVQVAYEVAPPTFQVCSPGLILFPKVENTKHTIEMGVIKRIIQRIRHHDDRYFRTLNLHLAAILFSQDFALVNVDKINPDNCEFVFLQSFELSETVERFEKKLTIFVDARKLIYAWKTLRAKINDPNL